MLSASIKYGTRITDSPNPNPMRRRSNVKPIVAPETNGSALRKPPFAPMDRVIMFTGPGDMDITSENTAIASKTVIWFDI